MKLLSEEEIWRVADALQPEMYLKGDVIISQGQKGGNCMYFIEDGQVSVYCRTPTNTVTSNGNFFLATNFLTSKSKTTTTANYLLYLSQFRSTDKSIKTQCKFHNLRKTLILNKCYYIRSPEYDILVLYLLDCKWYASTEKKCTLKKLRCTTGFNSRTTIFHFVHKWCAKT